MQLGLLGRELTAGRTFETAEPIANSAHDSPRRDAAREKLAKLKAALEAHFGSTVTLKVTLGESAGASAAAIEAGERDERRAEAQRAVQADGFVKDLVNLFDGKVVPFALGHLTAGGTTEGHRFMGGAPFQVSDHADYVAKLAIACVRLSHAERREAILAEARKLWAREPQRAIDLLKGFTLLRIEAATDAPESVRENLRRQVESALRQAAREKERVDLENAALQQRQIRPKLDLDVRSRHARPRSNRIVAVELIALAPPLLT